MSINLSTEQRAQLSRSVYAVENLIEIQRADPANNFYYTTGFYDVDVQTDTSGGVVTFSASNSIQTVDTIPQKTFFADIRTSITFASSNLTTALTFDLGDTVNIHKMFRDTSTNAPDIDSATAPIHVFSGIVVGRRLNATKQSSRLQLELANTNLSLDRYANLPAILVNLSGVG